MKLQLFRMGAAASVLEKATEEQKAEITAEIEKMKADGVAEEEIEKVLKEKEVRQCNEYLAKLRGHPDWYYWQDKIKLVESLEKGAIVEEQLYPGKRHKRNGPISCGPSQ